MTDPYETIDPGRLVEGSVQQTGALHLPIVEVLFHYDLDAVGFVTSPPLFLGGEAVSFGRDAPLFVRPERGHGGERRALGDPCISRHQFTLRWVRSLQCFEIVVAKDSRRALTLLSQKGGEFAPRFEPIHERAMAYPGACLAIGNRAMLLLDSRPCRDEGFERMGMVGEHGRLWMVRDEISRVARFQRPVLIQGETGTGKELAARALHERSEHRSGPFLAVNCGAIPEHLIESQLFGHRKGAFTGADKDSLGLFRSAEGGSVFLDEIGELSPLLQTRLLRTLQESVVTPVGSVEEVKVNVRVIAATNLDLQAMVDQGRFREDLYYRLMAHVLTLPPLRQRVSDVPRLFVHFLRQHRSEHEELGRLWRKADGAPPPIPIGFFAELLSDPWRGNVRHLQNVVEATASRNLDGGAFKAPDLSKLGVAQRGPIVDEVAVLGGAKGVVEPQAVEEEVPPRLDAALVRVVEAIGSARGTVLKLVPATEIVELGVEHGDDPQVLALQVQERVGENLWRLLEHNDYNQTRAADVLSVSRTTLVKLMQTLGFQRPRDLTAQVVLEASARVGSDLEVLAGHLKVSRRGLKLRLSELGLEF